MDSSSGKQTTQTCPDCGTPYPHIAGATPWCDNCGWNLTPHLPDKQPPRDFQRQQKFFETIGDNPDLRSPFTAGMGVALVVAALVYAGWLGIVAYGVSTILRLGRHYPVCFVGGILVLAIAFASRPRFGRVPRDAAKQDDMPALFAMANEVAGALKVGRVSGLMFDASYSADALSVGLGRRVVLRIGLPLWTTLTDDERVALVARALARVAEPELAKKLFLRGALTSLNSWELLLRYRQGAGDATSRLASSTAYNYAANARGGVMGGANRSTDALGDAVTSVIVFLPELTAKFILRLVWRDSILAALRADRRAAGVAGAGALLGALDKRHTSERYMTLLQRAALSQNYTDDLFAALRQRIEDLEPREWERIRRMQRLPESWLQPDLPLTAQRIAMLVNMRDATPHLSADAFDFAAVGSEVARLRAGIQTAAIDAFRSLSRSKT